MRFYLFLLGLPIETAAKLTHFVPNKKKFFSPPFKLNLKQF